MIVHVLVLVGGGLLGLVSSLVGDLRPEWLVATLLGGCVGDLSVTVYFVLFWSDHRPDAGHAGDAASRRTADGTPPSIWRAFVRLIGLLLAIVPFFAGFLPVLFDSKRRALPDYLARTVVLYADRTEPHGVVTSGP